MCSRPSFRRCRISVVFTTLSGQVTKAKRTKVICARSVWGSPIRRSVSRRVGFLSAGLPCLGEQRMRARRLARGAMRLRCPA